MVFDFEILTTAGLSAGDLTKLLEIPLPNNSVKHVSRTTAYNWTRGNGEPSSLVEPYVSELLERISKAVDAKELPLKLNTPRKDRIDSVKRALNAE